MMDTVAPSPRFQMEQFLCHHDWDINGMQLRKEEAIFQVVVPCQGSFRG